jgi:hypothetical protein
MASNNQAALIALNSQTHLLRIEPELCNTIYKLVFASAETCDDALLLVSTQIRSEARSIYYSMHPFKVEVTADSLPCFAAWAAGLTHSVLVNFKKLHVVFWLDDKHLSKGLDEGYVICFASLGFCYADLLISTCFLLLVSPTL